MGRRVEDDICSIEELRNRFKVMIPTLSNFGIVDLYAVKSFPPDYRMYAYFINNSGGVVDKIRYICDGNLCDHVVSGNDYNEIYRDLNYVVVNYIFGYVSGF